MCPQPPCNFCLGLTLAIHRPALTHCTSSRYILSTQLFSDRPEAAERADRNRHLSLRHDLHTLITTMGYITDILTKGKKLVKLELASSPNMLFLYLLAVLGAVFKPKWTNSKTFPALLVRSARCAAGAVWHCMGDH